MIKFIDSITHKIRIQKYESHALALSGILCALSILAIIFLTPNFGIYFTGGVKIQVGIEHKANVLQILKDNNIEKFEISNNDNILTIKSNIKNLDMLESSLLSNDIEILTMNKIGGKVSDMLKEYSIIACVLAFLGISICMWWQFNTGFAVSALTAIIHDILIVTMLLIIFQFPITITTIAALITIAGYSINDSIVVLDRMKSYHYPKQYDVVIQSVFTRTILTSVTTALAAIIICFAPNEDIRYMSITIIIGIIIGTYSSLFIALPLGMKLQIKPQSDSN